MNKVIELGNLTRDVELKTVGANNSQVAKFAVAVNEKYKDKEKTMFIDCNCWGNRAGVLEKYFKKGSRILVEGKLEQETWDKDGEKRSKHVINVSDFWFIDRNGDKHEVEDGGETPSSKPAAKKNSTSASKKSGPVENEETPPF